MSKANPSYANVTTAGVMPSATLKTGTISSYRTSLYGSETQFNSEINVSDFIYSQNQVREVINIISDNELEISSAFDPELSDSTPLYIVDTTTQSQSIINIGNKTAYLGTRDYDAQSFVVGARIQYASSTTGPIAYDPSGSILIISNGEFDIVDLSAAQNDLTVFQNNLDLLTMTSEEGIVALPGGGQALATQLTCKLNRVDTVATAGDSVRLPTAILNTEITIENFGAESMDLFPSIADNILGFAINIAYPISPGGSTTLFCYANGTWTIK